VNNSKWADLQKVDICDEHAVCRHCGSSLSDLSNFVYADECETGPRHKDELCKCNSCGMHFVLHYDLFDEKGHILEKVFVGDINSREYNWQDILTDEQKKAISEHLTECKTCQERLEEEILTDAWFASFMEDLRKHVKKGQAG